MLQAIIVSVLRCVAWARSGMAHAQTASRRGRTFQATADELVQGQLSSADDDSVNVQIPLVSSGGMGWVGSRAGRLRGGGSHDRCLSCLPICSAPPRDRLSQLQRGDSCLASSLNRQRGMEADNVSKTVDEAERCVQGGWVGGRDGVWEEGKNQGRIGSGRRGRGREEGREEYGRKLTCPLFAHRKLTCPLFAHTRSLDGILAPLSPNFPSPSLLSG
eukprot:1859751-Rhodomonas_salina.1